jgi:acid phosphatase family membrane protein YuiD
MNFTIVDSVILLAASAITTVVFVQLFKTILNSILIGKFDLKTLLSDGDFPSSHTSILVSFNIVFWLLIYVYHLSHPEVDMFAAVLSGLVLALWSCYEIRDAMGVRLRVQEHAHAIKLIAQTSKELSDKLDDLKLGDDNLNSKALEESLDNLLKNIKLKAGHLPHEVLGGIVTDETSFSSLVEPDFIPVLSKLRENNAQGLIIVASDIDTALIAQRARFMGWQVPMFAAAWAQTETLINNGGRAVEGMELEQAYALAGKSQAFIDFQARYKARFGNSPSFGASYSYESTLVLVEALKKTDGNKDGLKQALLEIKNFKGLLDTISINKYGDVIRPSYLTAIHNGKFITVDKLALTSSGGE